MAGPASKNTAVRHLADADFHAREAAAALKRARDQASSPGARDTLDDLAGGQRSVRRILARVGEHLRQRQLETTRRRTR